MERPHRKAVTLVLGGVRSGKSRFALQMALRAQSVRFIATAQPCDEEMQRKIERHQAERPAHWQTCEEPLDIAVAITEAEPDCELIVVDCLTVFVGNAMHAHGDDRAAIDAVVNRLCDALRIVDRRVVLVSNEVGWGVVPPYESGRQFRDLLGELNQRVAEIANNVVLMVAGLPLVLKGSIEDLQ